jgi:hypothetical protein
LLSLCLDIVLHVCSVSPFRREPFLRSSSLGQGVVLDLMSVSLPQIFLSSIFRLKCCNRIQNLNCNKVKFLEHFICLILVCDILYVITSVMAPRNDPGLD